MLLHVVFYAKIGEEKEAFDIADVCNALCDKLIFRHPHVFGDTQADSARKVEKSWEQIKLKEKGGNSTILGGVPNSLPSMVKAYRIQDKARNAGFDWNKRQDVWEKVKEEWDELKTEIAQSDPDKMEGEFGDLLFSIINAARLYKVNPDNALERTNQKFIHRFNYMEQKAKRAGKNIEKHDTRRDGSNLARSQATRKIKEEGCRKYDASLFLILSIDHPLTICSLSRSQYMVRPSR